MSLEVKAAVFDADGVVVQAQQPFSHHYAETRGLDPARFTPFFKGPFQAALVGQADLKELIVEHNDIWQWEDDPQTLLDLWFETENRVDSDLQDVIRTHKARGLPVFLATNNEQYRTDYLRTVMFPGLFDAIFSSCEIGHLKDTDAFWKPVIERIKHIEPQTKQPHAIVLFDDDEDNLDAASMQKLRTYLYEGAEQVDEILSRVAAEPGANPLAIS